MDGDGEVPCEGGMGMMDSRMLVTTDSVAQVDNYYTASSHLSFQYLPPHFHHILD